MQSPNLACCPPMSGNVAAHNFEPLENLQNDEAASALTEELTSCNGSQGQLEAAISFMDWRWKEKKTMAVDENLGPADGIADSCSEPSNSTPLFGKTVTPSDVGKLNRLVIPKQHAEKYFPLDVHSSDRGLLLNFEDNTGKSWRFRYSYWNSSQSYVLTKGWSRFVKDKKLEAGDIVSFHRGTTEARQLYIACRRRPCAQNQNRTPRVQRKGALGLAYSSFDSATAYNPQLMHILWPNSRPRDGHMERVVWPPQSSANPLYFSAPTEADLPSVVEAPAENKREQPLSTKEKEVRVFGVNLAGSQRLGELMLFPS